MHVVAELVFFSKEPKNTALSLQHTANGHFHVASLAKLTNVSTPDNPSSDGGKTFNKSKTAGRTLSVASSLKLSFCFFNPEGKIMVRFVSLLLWAVNDMESFFQRTYFNDKLIPIKNLMCLTHHKLQNIPLVSCCLHLWSCLDCFFVNNCTFSAYLLHLLLKTKITCLINRDRSKNKMKIQLIFEIFYYEISCYNLLLFSFFVQQPMGSAHPRTHTSVTGVS